MGRQPRLRDGAGVEQEELGLIVVRPKLRVQERCEPLERGRRAADITGTGRQPGGGQQLDRLAGELLDDLTLPLVIYQYLSLTLVRGAGARRQRWRSLSGTGGPRRWLYCLIWRPARVARADGRCRSVDLTAAVRCSGAPLLLVDSEATILMASAEANELLGSPLEGRALTEWVEMDVRSSLLDALRTGAG